MKKYIGLILVGILSVFIIYDFLGEWESKQTQEEIKETIQAISNETFENDISTDKKDEFVPREKFVKLMEAFDNEDIKGYIKIEGTSIEYPVLQSQDNEFYLEHDIYKNESKAGSIFLDYENDIKKLDYNTVIYGHNMKADIMFHDLRYYSSEKYWEEHPYIEYSTLYNDYVYEIFSVYETSIDFPYITVLFDSDESFYQLSTQFKSNSIYETGVALDVTDKVITLSTCPSFSLASDRRFVVQGKLITVNGETYE